jgi:hypothetical protein
MEHRHDQQVWSCQPSWLQFYAHILSFRRIHNPEKSGRPDMLTYLMENDNAKGVSIAEMTSHLSSIMYISRLPRPSFLSLISDGHSLAGGGTTSIVLGAMIYYLMYGCPNYSLEFN